ncbi:hypothetical protein [Listeria sp. PSOL-1]|uniref:hypothetical protein n=1 Tax=Listeria sp. PSOL-1 TaxID=1844999 RepID=UPI001E299EB7|nr:hypothetical protein [Listeria sp. PSOL-1]
MKKMMAFLLSVGLVFLPIGGNAINEIVPAKYEQITKADAKGYRSSRRSFNPGNNHTTTRKSPVTNNGKQYRSGRGFLGGLMVESLAGLLFGGLLPGLGSFLA